MNYTIGMHDQIITVLRIDQHVMAQLPFKVSPLIKKKTIFALSLVMQWFPGELLQNSSDTKI